MKKITENNYMTVFSDLELSACIQTEHKSQDLQISRIDVQPKTLPEGLRLPELSGLYFLFLQLISADAGTRSASLTGQ